jgi:toxin ParE1/3/4
MIRQRPRAVEAIISQATYLAGESPRAADQFLAGVDETLAMLERMPRAGRAWDSSKAHMRGARWWPVRGFRRHILVYRPIRGGIELLHVYHASQNLDDLF